MVNEFVEGFTGPGLFFGSRMPDRDNCHGSNCRRKIDDLTQGVFSVHSNPTGAQTTIRDSKEQVHRGNGRVLNAETVSKDVVLFTLVGLRISTDNDDNRSSFHEVLGCNSDSFL